MRWDKGTLKLCMVIVCGLVLAMIASGCIDTGSFTQTPANGNNTGETDLTGVQTVNITDSLGRTVAVPVPARRIVALYSGTAETLVAIGAGGNIVGTADPTFDTRPWLLQYMHQPVKVGSLFTPNIEQIVALHPDLVIALPNTEQYAEKIESAGIPIIYLQTDNINDIIPATRMLGNITGQTKNASLLVSFYQDNFNIVDERVAQIPLEERPRVYMEMYSDFAAVPRGSPSDILINRTGGHNVLEISDNDSNNYPRVSAEWLTNMNPDIVIRAVNTAQNPEVDLVPYYQRFFDTSGLNTINAVRNNRVYIITGEMLYGPRSFAGFLAMAKIMHPELFTDVDPRQKLEEYASRFIPGANSTGARMYPEL